MQPKLIESAGLVQKSLHHSGSPTHNEKAGKMERKGWKPLA